MSQSAFSASEVPHPSRLEKLETSLKDLANDNRDLRAQLLEVLQAVETLTAGRSPELLSVQVWGPAPTYPPTENRGSSRRMLGFLLRVVRSLLRRGRALLGRVWTAADPALEVIPLAKPDLPARVPSVTLLLDEASFNDLSSEVVSRYGAINIEWILWRQTEKEFEALAGEGMSRRRGIAATPAELRDAATGDYCLRADFPLKDLPPAVLETALLTLATEPLAFLRLGLARLDAGRREVLMVRRPLWDPQGGLDAELGRGLREEVLGKTAVAEYGGLPQGFAGWLQGTGQYFVARGRLGKIYHPLRNLDALAGKKLAGKISQSAPPSSRPTLGILLTASPVGGVESLLAELRDHLDDQIEILVFALKTSDGFSAERLSRLALCGQTQPDGGGFQVFPLASILEPQMVGAALSHILRHRDVRRLLHIGDVNRLQETIPDAPQRFAELTWLDLALEVEPWRTKPASEVPSPVEPAARIALNDQAFKHLAERHGEGHSRRLPISPPGELSDQRLDDDASRREMRSRLGLPEEALVVVLVSDLVPTARPEDFVALAQRFKADPDFIFLLIGDGPLAGGVSDLVNFWGLSNLRHWPSCAELARALAASDIFCLTAELEPLPYKLLMAQAIGLPTVAVAGDGAEELLSDNSAGSAESCGLIVPRVGDLEGLEKAIRQLSDADSRHRMGEEARRRASARPTPEEARQAWNELLAL